tara:strand:- start:675 stop:2435 length:1761 start_codon:yes stop_codon:yes gene_type:complete
MGFNLACIVLTACCGSAQDSEPTHWVEVYDLRSLTASALKVGGGVDMLHPGGILLGELEPDRPDIVLGDPVWTLTDHELDQLAHDFLAPGPFPDEAKIKVVAGFLTLDGSAAQHEMTERWTHTLYSHLHRMAGYELYRLDRIPPDWSGVLSAEQVQDWLDASGEVPDHEVRNPLGVRVLLGARASKALPYDLDVEVAQFEAVSDPSITRAMDSFELGAVALETSDGRFFVRQWGVTSTQVGEPRHFQFLESVPNFLMLPTIQGTKWTSSGVIEDGGGMVVGHEEGSRGVSLLVIRKERTQDPEQDSEGVPIGILTAPPVQSWASLTRDVSPSGGQVPLEQEWDELALPAYQPDGLVSALVEATRAVGAKLDWRLVHAAAFPITDTSAAQIGREWIASWEKRLARTISIEVRYGYVDSKDWSERRLASANAEDWLDLLGRRVVTQARSGDSVFVHGTLSTWYLQDYDVQIAQGVSITDPIVADSETGMKFWCRPRLAPGGKIQAWTHFGVAAEVAPMEVIEAHFPYAPAEKAIPLVTSGRIELPNVEIVNEVQESSLESGRWTPLVVSKMDGLDRVLVAVLRLTADR